MKEGSGTTFGKRVIAFNAGLEYGGKLPDGVAIMNPFRENACATPASEEFYHKFYADNNKRIAILGINPGRFGAGITGVPFTDPVRLSDPCGIQVPECPSAREPSSVFVYAVIDKYGGLKQFYDDYYINSICPLGFTRINAAGRHVNYNYYDSRELERLVTPFILETLARQIACGLEKSICFCFGKGKNFNFMEKINREHNFFDKIVPLDHPRFVMQYKSAEMEEYAQNYAQIFRQEAKRIKEHPTGN